MTHQYRLPYGRRHLSFSLPDGMRATMLETRSVAPVADPRAAIDQALSNPVGAPPLRELAHPGDRVTIVFTDATRASPDHLLVPAILRQLEMAGVRDEDVTLLCGIGMHRPSTPEEKAAKLGAETAARYRVIDNQPRNSEMVVDLGTTPQGVPISIHRAVVEADLAIGTGLVEPHQYAGYSGGRKTVAIGAGGEPLIAATHGPRFLDQAGTRLGWIEANPFHAAITEAARRGGLRFILNVVLDGERRVLKVAAGAPEAAFAELVAFARSVYEVAVAHSYDVAIGGVGWPKDVNLYQASRAASYLFFAPRRVVKPGGVIIVPARCQEGAGTGVGERRFLSAMRDAPDVQAILCDARANGYPPGQQRAFVMAKVLEEVRVIIVGSECPDIVTACQMEHAPTVEQALSAAADVLGPELDVLIVLHALLTLPVVTPL